MDMKFEPEIDPDLFDEDLIDEIENEFAMAEDYDDHAWDEEELEEEEMWWQPRKNQLQNKRVRSKRWCPNTRRANLTLENQVKKLSLVSRLSR